VTVKGSVTYVPTFGEVPKNRKFLCYRIGRIDSEILVMGISQYKARITGIVLITSRNSALPTDSHVPGASDETASKVIYGLFNNAVSSPVHEASNKIVIALMMEVASTSERSVNFYQTTRRNNPEAIFILAAART
jgi:hypothetical protein